MQFFLSDIPKDKPRFQPGSAVYYLDTPWAFCSLMQGAGFWQDYRPFAENVKHVFSCTYTSRYGDGILTGKKFTECTREEIYKECIAQCGIPENLIVGWALDRELAFMSPEEYKKALPELRVHDTLPNTQNQLIINYSPLAVEMPGSHRDDGMPGSRLLDNLFVCGEYTKTSFPLATMERACESGYRASAAILQNAGIVLEIPQSMIFPVVGGKFQLGKGGSI